MKRQLVFCGGGGKYNYSLGVLATIQKHFDLSDIIISGTSSGCFPAFIASSNLNAYNAFERYNIPLLATINKYTSGALGNWNKVVREHTNAYMPEKTFLNVSNKLYIQLTEFPNLKGSMINTWKSNRELLDTLMASSFIPIFDTFKLYETYNGKKYIDGSISNNNPIPFDNSPYFLIHSERWRKLPFSYFWCWGSTLHARTLFEMGRLDAEKHIEELNEFFKK